MSLPALLLVGAADNDHARRCDFDHCGGARSAEGDRARRHIAELIVTLKRENPVGQRAHPEGAPADGHPRE